MTRINRHFTAGVAALNTDDLPVLEFHALRNRFRKFHPGT